MVLESLAGRIMIQVVHDGNRVKDLNIHSTRPMNTHQLFIGRSVEDVLTLIPVIYSLCGDAQKVAALHAVEQAAGLQVHSSVAQARSALIAAEAGRELLLRLIRLGHISDLIQPASVIRWHSGIRAKYAQTLQPGFDLTVDIQQEEFRSEYLDLLSPLSAQSNNPTHNLCELNLALDQGNGPLSAIHQRLGECFAHLPVAEGCPVLVNTMPELMSAMALGTDFCQAPQINGQCYETGVWAKYCDSHIIRSAILRREHTVQLRFRALISAISDIPGWVERADNLFTTGSKDSPKPAEGLGAVMASRGILIHRVQLSEASIGAKVNEYQIVAPTEWNFHSAGTLTQMLKGARVATQSIVELTRALVTAIDPCVECQVELVYA